MFYFWRISMRKSMEKFTFVHGKPLSRQSSTKSRHLSSKFTLKFTELLKEPAFNFYLLLFLNFYEIRHELFHFASAIFSLARCLITFSCFKLKVIWSLLLLDFFQPTKIPKVRRKLFFLDRENPDCAIDAVIRLFATRRDRWWERTECQAESNVNIKANVSEKIQQHCARRIMSLDMCAFGLVWSGMRIDNDDLSEEEVHGNLKRVEDSIIGCHFITTSIFVSPRKIIRSLIHSSFYSIKLQRNLSGIV